MSDEIINDEAVETKVDDIAEQQEAAAPEEDSKPRSNRARANRKAAAESEDSSDVSDETSDKVVLFVDHPIYWPAVGKLAKGFNVVPSHVADKWLEKGWARKASAAEVKKHYGV